MDIREGARSTDRNGAGLKHALVLGGSGLLGGSLVRLLCEAPNWKATSLSRRPPATSLPVHHVGVDLLDPAQLQGCSGEFAGITHVFFCSRAVAEGYAIGVDSNLTMLANLLDVLLPAAPALEHVQLVHGLKWYGSHVGPIKLPAKESDPPHADSSFYQKQLDHLMDRQAGQRWTWSSVRPHFICGVATDSPSNLVGVLGAFAAILRELGDDLWFPGPEEAFGSITNVVDVDLLTRSMLWMATSPDCANNSFNVTNGDCFRWCDIWPRIARQYGMKPGRARPTDLRLFMADKEPVWRSIVGKHGLRATPFHTMADWNFAHNNVFGLKWDIFASTVKAHRFGFSEMIDSEEMFDRLFAEYRALRILP